MLYIPGFFLLVFYFWSFQYFNLTIVLLLLCIIYWIVVFNFSPFFVLVVFQSVEI